MPHPLLAAANDTSKPIWLVNEQTWPAIAGQLPPMAQGFARAQGFEGKAGSHCLLPDAEGNLFGVAFGLDGADAKLSRKQLPPLRRHVGGNDLVRTKQPLSDDAARNCLRHVSGADDAEFKLHLRDCGEGIGAGQLAVASC